MKLSAKVVLFVVAVVVFPVSLLKVAHASGTPTLVYSRNLSALINTANGGNGFNIQYGGSMGAGSLANNLIVLDMTYPHGSTLSSIADNKGDAYTLASSADSGSGGWITAMYYLAGAPAGITQITVNFSATVGDWHGSVREYSGVATSAPLDGTCSNNNAVPGTVQCGSPIVTSANGDLVLGSTMLVGNLSSNLCGNVSSAMTPGGSSFLDSADPFCSDAEDEYVQASAGSITPSFSITGNTDRFNIVGAAFKAASAGTNPTGMYILHEQTVLLSEGVTSQKNYFVSNGNLLVASLDVGSGGGDTVTINSCSNSDTWTEYVPTGEDAPEIFYVPSATTSPSMICTIHMSNSGYVGLLTIYDVVGAAASPKNAVSGFYAGNGSFVTDMPDITPTVAPGIAFAVINDGTGPETGIGPGAIFDNTPYAGETDAGAMNNGDGWQHYFYQNTSKISFDWDQADPSSYIQAAAIAFSAATSSNTLPTISSFSASPTLIASAGTSTLSWSVSNASSVAIAAPGFSLSTSTLVGSTTVNPTSTALYTLTATNGNGTSTATTSVSVATPPTVPTNLSATPISSSQVNLSWTPSTDPIGVAGYYVYRNATQVGTSATSSYSDTGLIASTMYTYTVAAYDSVGDVSAQSASTSTTTFASNTTPPTISLVTPTNGATVSSTILVSGTASDTLAVTSVTVSIDGGAGANAIGTTTWMYALNTGTLANGTHTIVATAADTSDNQATTSPTTIIVDNYPAITSSMTATSTFGQAFSYQITASNGPTSFNASNLPAGLSVSTTTGLISGTPTIVGTSSVTLSATNSGGTGSGTLVITITNAPDTTPPITPTNLSVSGTTTSTVSLSWATSTDPVVYGQVTSGVAGYSIYRGGILMGTSTSAAFMDTNLTPSTTYSYTVAAYDNAGNVSATSSAVNGTTQSLDTIPPTTAITFPANNASVSSTITVTAVASDNVGVTMVQFYLDGTLQATATSSSYAWIWNTAGVSNGTHTLQTKAYDAAGNVGTSTIVTVTVSNTTSTTPAFVQSSTSPFDGSKSPVKATFSKTTKSGDAIVVWATDGASTPVMTVTDNAGNTYTAATAPVTNTGCTQSQQIFYATNIKATSTPLTVTVAYSSAGQAAEAFIYEFSGIATSNPLDASSTTATVTKANASTSAVTLTGSPELAFSGFVGCKSAATAGTNYTLGVSDGSEQVQTEYWSTASGTIKGVWTNTSQPTTVQLAVFK